MKRISIISSIKSTMAYCSIGLGMLALASCNKDFANRLPFDQEHQDVKVEETQYKIAYVVLEGGVGTIVAREATDYGAMPTLGELSIRSITSWNGVSAENKEELTSYADLLTGVEYPKHQVQGAGTDNNLENFPTLFTRIKQQSNIHTAFITSNSNLTSLVKEADVDVYQLENGDEQVAERAGEELAKDNVGVVVATFKDVDQIGQSAGYDSEAYIQALSRFDEQLNGLVTTIRARQNYSNERWLIVVTSSKGGDYALQPELDDGSIFADTERNNFVVVHNPQFTFKLTERMQLVDPAWMGSAIRYTGNQGKAVIPVADATIYNLEKNREYTIQMKIKVHSYGEYNQTVFSKRENTNGGQDGWGIMIGRAGGDYGDLSRGSFRFKVAGTEVYATADIELETWYSVIVRVYVEGDKQYATVFRDGIEYNTGEITNAQGVSDQPLQLGYAAGFATVVATQSHSIADIRIYNVAKSIEDIQNAYCTTLATPGSDHYFNNLIGYWPGDDGGAELRDRSGNNRHFMLEGNYSWNSFSERSATLCPTLPDNPERYVVRSVDVPRMIYSWLNFKGIEQFNLDAQIWNPSFSNN